LRERPDFKPVKEKHTAGTPGKVEKGKNRKRKFRKKLRGPKRANCGNLADVESAERFEECAAGVQKRQKYRLKCKEIEKPLPREDVLWAWAASKGKFAVERAETPPNPAASGRLSFRFQNPGGFSAMILWLLERLPGAPATRHRRRGGQGTDPRPQGPTAARDFWESDGFRDGEQPAVWVE